MMLDTVRPTRHRSAARVLRGWLVRGVRQAMDGSLTNPQEGEIRTVTHYEHGRGFGVRAGPWRPGGQGDTASTKDDPIPYRKWSSS
jgi:hypothetical protein